MKIAVYAICKDEPKEHILRFMNCCAGIGSKGRGADHIVIADTGSDDKTLYELEGAKDWLWRHHHEVQVEIHNISIQPWRFDLARNVALALVPPDVDVCIRLDLDEVLEPGWRAAVEAVWNGKTNQLCYEFEHYPGYVFHATNIHARHGFLWRGLDHEGLYPAPGRISVRTFAPGLRITHHQDHTKPRTAILPRLEAACREEKTARNLWYLGREYSYYRHHQKCIDTLQEYLAHPEATWDCERMAARCLIGDAYRGLRLYPLAVRSYIKAASEYYTREPFLGLVETLRQAGRLDEARYYAQVALTLNNKLTTIHQNMRAWDGTLESLAESLEPATA